jgi:hypothetical protein
MNTKTFNIRDWYAMQQQLSTIDSRRPQRTTILASASSSFRYILPFNHIDKNKKYCNELRWQEDNSIAYSNRNSSVIYRLVQA